MIDIKSIHKEDISTAYLKLLAASNDVTKISRGNRDHDGVDCELHIVDVENIDFKNVQINVQVKSSINVIERKNHFAFDMPVSNYNKFCVKSQNPQVFAILQLPKDLDFVEFNDVDKYLLVRYKMFWYVIPKGTEESVNIETVTLEIPKENYFTVNNFREICSKIVQEFYSDEEEGEENETV